MIKLIESYVTWGYINKYTIEELLRKRGSVTFGNNEPNELDNVQIEDALGKFGIVCIEDIIHELTNETKNAKAVLNYLGYFKLEANDDGFEKAVLYRLDECVMFALNLKALGKMAEILGNNDDNKLFDEYYKQCCESIKNRFWDEEKDFFFDIDVKSGKICNEGFSASHRDERCQ